MKITKATSIIFLIRLGLTEVVRSCPIYDSHFHSLWSLPTHGKTAIAEASRACASTCDDCCKSSLTQCGISHVQGITPNFTIPIDIDVPVTHDLPSLNQTLLSLFLRASLNHLRDVSTSPNTMLIPSASSYKPHASQKIMPFLEVWDTADSDTAHSDTAHSDTADSDTALSDRHTIMTSKDLWQVKAIFKSAQTSRNDDVFGLLMDFNAYHVLVLRGDRDRYFNCDVSADMSCATPAFEAALMTLQFALPAETQLIVTAEDPGAVKAAETLVSKLQTATFQAPSGVAQGGLCAFLCPSVDVSGKPRRLERQDGAEYIHVDMPGGMERSFWLAILATLVMLGSWNGSYKMSTVTF